MITVTETGEIQTIRLEKELRICPHCGYERGFHTSFVNIHAEKPEPFRCTQEVYRVILICPECGSRYDIGWKVAFPGQPDVPVKFAHDTGSERDCIPVEKIP